MKIESDIGTTVTERLEGNLRDNIRRIVMAGADTAEKRVRQNTQQRRHVRTGDMLAAIGSSPYKEALGGGETDVYPLGTDRKGVRNATKAYVINYGRGRKRNGGKMGDHFITGDKQAEAAVLQAMQAESDRIADEMSKE